MMVRTGHSGTHAKERWYEAAGTSLAARAALQPAALRCRCSPRYAQVMRLSAAWLPALLALIPCPSAQEPDPTSCPDLTGDLLVDVEVSAITILAARETASCFSH